MHTTKLTVEISFQTQFGPHDAVQMMDILTRFPVVTEVNITKLETDYVPNPAFPNDINAKAIKNIPIKIR